LAEEAVALAVEVIVFFDEVAAFVVALLQAVDD